MAVFKLNRVASITACIVWVTKYAVTRVSGRKFYDEFGVPAALGIIAGEMLGIILVSATNNGRSVAFGG
jgi:hypothetical protein